MSAKNSNSTESQLRIYSTLSRSVEPFTPLIPGKVSIYACGVTVYDDSHIGHARQAIVFDVIRRYLQFLGYQVTYVRNFTDVDDKIIRRAQQLGISAADLANRVIESTHRDFRALKIRPADFEPTVTDSMREIVELILLLLNKGVAYQCAGDVLFDVRRFPDYGKLSNRRLEECLNSDESSAKRNPQDFALWKAAKPDEPAWDSPWGPGRPGWHIECSAMVKKYLGESIDIHGGGVDLVFPHHENEVAQSEAANCKPFARYWLHNGLVNVGGQKMSKSLGNQITIEACLAAHPPEVLRYAVLAQTFTSAIDFSDQLFRTATKRIYYLYRTLLRVDELLSRETPSEGKPHSGQEVALADTIRSGFCAAMNDSFNTGAVLASLSTAFAKMNEILDSKESAQAKAEQLAPAREALRPLAEVLGLLEEDPAQCVDQFRKAVLKHQGVTEQEIADAIARRQQAKTAKDFALADSVRAELLKRQIALQDRAGGRVEWDIVFE